MINHPGDNHGMKVQIDINCRLSEQSGLKMGTITIDLLSHQIILIHRTYEVQSLQRMVGVVKMDSPQSPAAHLSHLNRVHHWNFEIHSKEPRRKRKIVLREFLSTDTIPILRVVSTMM